MAQIEIDSNKIKMSAENLKKQAKDLNEVINNMFYKFENLENSRTWIGDGNTSSVHMFMEKVSKDKEMYMNYANSINKLGDLLISMSNKLSAEVEKGRL